MANTNGLYCPLCQTGLFDNESEGTVECPNESCNWWIPAHELEEESDE